jgi:hypothetical protein
MIGLQQYLAGMMTFSVSYWPILRPRNSTGANKNVNSRTKLSPKFWPDIPRKGQKRGRILKNVLFPLFFPHESIENQEFSQILVLVWFQNLVLF